MKKQIFLAAAAALLSVATVSAQQGGGMPRRTVEERVKTVHTKLDSAFKMDAAKLKEADVIFTDYYTAQDKAREGMQPGGDRDAMRAKMQELGTERDGKLKTVFTEEQMKKWKDEIEPSMRQGRGNRPQGGGGQ